MIKIIYNMPFDAHCALRELSVIEAFNTFSLHAVTFVCLHNLEGGFGKRID